MKPVTGRTAPSPTTGAGKGAKLDPRLHETYKEKLTPLWTEQLGLMGKGWNKTTSDTERSRRLATEIQNLKESYRRELAGGMEGMSVAELAREVTFHGSLLDNAQDLGRRAWQVGSGFVESLTGRNGAAQAAFGLVDLENDISRVRSEAAFGALKTRPTADLEKAKQALPPDLQKVVDVALAQRRSGG